MIGPIKPTKQATSFYFMASLHGLRQRRFAICQQGEKYSGPSGWTWCMQELSSWTNAEPAILRLTRKPRHLKMRCAPKQSRASKYPIFEVSGSKNHTPNGIWDQSPWSICTWTLRAKQCQAMGLGLLCSRSPGQVGFWAI